MRVFITGGGGFIGSQVVKELKRRNHTVHLLSARLAHVNAIEKELKKFKPDCVIHLAWEGLPDIRLAMSSKNRTNGIAFFRLIEKFKIPKLIAIGSAWQYENTAELKVNGHASFVAAKKALQVFGKEVMKKHGGVFIWVIPFFVYGKGKKDVSLVPSLLRQARERKTPTPKNPDAWHDFVYVDDVARAIALLATKKVSTGSYDMGSGSLTRTGDIALRVARAYNLPRLKLGPVAKKGLRANIRRLKKATGWAPRVPISKGIAAMIKSVNGK